MINDHSQFEGPLAELAQLLAGGILRYRQQATRVGNLAQKSYALGLEVPSETVLSVTRLNRRESAPERRIR